MAQLKSFWRNLYIRLPDQSRSKKISESNYSLNSLGLALQETLKSEGGMVQVNTPNGGLEMHNPRNKKIIRDNDLANLLGIKRRLQEQVEFPF